MNDSLKLLSRRERKEVLGRNNANLWLLIVVITVTFLSIAFSNASMQYLSDRMDDPFTNWVDIDFRSKDNPQVILDSLRNENVMERFGYNNVQKQDAQPIQFYRNNDNVAYIYTRLFENFNNDLINAVLSPDNIISDSYISPDSMPSETVGVIINAKGLADLGYTAKTCPPYLNFFCFSFGADSLGIELTDWRYAKAPIPVLAVVKRLPGAYNMLATKLFYDNTYDNGTINLSRPEYLKDMVYFVGDNDYDEFIKRLPEMMPDSLSNKFMTYTDAPSTSSIKPGASGHIVEINPFGYSQSDNLMIYRDIESRIADAFQDKDVHRIYKYTYGKSSDYSSGQIADFLSINFNRLDKIKEFSEYMRGLGVTVDMAQVNAKDNFSAVSVMANILSWAMILFSIVCIVLFIVNMLQSYFQKVKRNMGTFKAFGLSSAKLIGVYVLMLLRIIVLAIIVALAVAWIIEITLPLLGIVKDGSYSYLSLWSLKTVMSALTMIAATVITVYVVIRSLLRRTPGDLIYDR